MLRRRPVGEYLMSPSRRSKPRLRVLVADDHPVTVAGVVAALAEEPDLEVVGEVGGAENLRTRIAELEPDVAVVDLQMWGLEGLQDIAELRQDGVSTRFLLLTDQSVRGSVGEALNLGVNGFVCKSEALPVITTFTAPCDKSSECHSGRSATISS